MRGLAQSAAALCLGSAAFHGSHTRFGRRADNDLIGIMSFILHQASISYLPSQFKTLAITDLGTVRSVSTPFKERMKSDENLLKLEEDRLE